MNLLIVTPFYKHDRNIASVRWTNIATRLAKSHNVIVVTQPHDDMDMTRDIAKDEDGVLVVRLNQKTSYELFSVRHLGGATGDDWQTSSGSGEETAPPHDGMVRKLKNRVLFRSMKQKAKAYAKDIQKNVIPQDMKIDAVLSSACPFIEMLFGYELKKRLGCKWISDFRDLPFYDDRPHVAQIMKKLMQKELNTADAIVSITHRGKAFLADGIVKDADKIHVINNGFSMADAREPVYQDDGVLHIVHTGSLYGGTRRADLFFEAASEARKRESAFAYVLECAGGNNESLIETAAKYGEEACVKNFGFIPREQALDMQGKADMLLALIFKTTGSFSAKLFEYTLNKKPVICVSRGEGEEGDESRYVRELNLGIAVEEMNREEDIQRLSDYLLAQFACKAAHRPLRFDPDKDGIGEYDHDRIVEKIEALCK